MEISSTGRGDGHMNSFRDKRRLSKAEWMEKSRELFWRKGSKILPDFFPLDMQPNNSINADTKSVLLTSVVKQYSWEKEELREAETIAESWMMYFGLESRDFTKWFGKLK